VDKKSTLGTCQFLDSWLVSWSSRIQSSVAQSTTKAVYVAAASSYSQLIWITYTLSDCQRFSSAQPTGVSTPVVYLFGEEKSRAKNSKAAHEHTKHKEHSEFILVRAS
jgi:hypothetical protein